MSCVVAALGSQMGCFFKILINVIEWSGENRENNVRLDKKRDYRFAF